MKTPNTLQKFADSKGLTVKVVRYHGNGKTSIGFDLVHPVTNAINLSLEPTWYSHGNRWKVTTKGRDGGLFYLKSLREIKMFSYLVAQQHTGYVFA